MPMHEKIGAGVQVQRNTNNVHTHKQQHRSNIKPKQADKNICIVEFEGNSSFSQHIRSIIN